MFEGRKTNHLVKWAEAYFILFILLQPILDMTAYINLPISEPIRVLTMGLGFIYILLLPNTRAKKFALGYIGVLALFMIASFANNFVFKDPFSLSVEMIYIIKTVYVLMMLIIYYFVFQSLSKRTNWRNSVQKYVFISMSIIGVVMVVSSITGTGKRSYDALAKEGHSGWFFAANELSAILAMGFSVMLLYFMRQSNIKTKLLYIPLLLSAIWGILTVGTKVGLGGLLMVLGFGSLIAFVDIWKKKQWSNAIIVPLLLAGTIAIIPFSAIGNNLGYTVTKMQEGNGADGTDPATGEDGSIDGPDRTEQAKELLSGRNDFLRDKINQFEEANISQKTLGMGRGGNYEDVPKLVEMDFIDWFFNYGVLGIIILALPIAFFGITIIKHLIETRFKVFDGETLLIGIAVGLGLGTAFLAGHVLSSPASGIYLVLFLAYLHHATKPTVKNVQSGSNDINSEVG
ncbi:O-antigen ligase family protein [Pontibacillus salicampi]|uniref:O-antigen ligase family protein n=1 Tax=Pontibacillus salicampi TaxID=1449801 RepID=A0ABV6LSA4_9BACI